MDIFPKHTADSAPAGAQASLRILQQSLGLIPNLAATMANSPTLVNSFVAAFGQLAGSSFTGAQRQVLLLSNAVTNNSAWPVAFHSTLALKEGVSPADVDAVRAGRLPADPTLAALSAVTRRLIETRGHLEDSDVKAFTEAGFDRVQLLEVITGVAISAMANYTSNLAQPPLEPLFQPQEWPDRRQ